MANIFLKFQGGPDGPPQGESQDTAHPQEIEIMSWSWGETNPGTFGAGGGGGSAAGVSMNDMSFSVGFSQASPALMKACAKSDHFDSATLTCRKGGGAAGGGQYNYLVIILTNVIVSSYQSGGSDGTDVAMDTFTLNYAQIEMDYFIQDNTGNVTQVPAFQWNLQKTSSQ